MRVALISVLVAAGCAAQGIKPRAQAADFPAQTEGKDFTLGAARIPADEVQAAFTTDLSRRYIVVEVAVYPRNGQPVDVNADDFVLRVAGSKDIVRPVRAKTVAAVLQKSAPADRNIDLYPTVGVGYETGGYDPATGRRGGGLTTSTGLGVGIGNSRPASTPEDRKVMETELTEKGLPEGKTGKPVAGYLYFPSTPKKKAVAYELEYQSPSGPAVLPLNSK